MTDSQPAILPSRAEGACAAERSPGHEAARRASAVAVLTGGGDKPYAIGIATALSAAGLPHDLIGSDELDVPEIRELPHTVFLNLRGNQSNKAGLLRKVQRIVRYYLRLLAYAPRSKAKVFHILWHNYFLHFDRTILLLYYRLFGKRLVFTAHNVNTEARDARDTAFNRFTLRLQYRLVDHVFVHTQKMKEEVLAQFGISDRKVSVIPFGINETNPQTSLTHAEARKSFGFGAEDQVVLFFGNIAEYKGLHLLVEAFSQLAPRAPRLRLLVAGRLKCSPVYAQNLQTAIAQSPNMDRITLKTEFIADEEVERYFKAADALVLPYTYIFQSGVLSLGYNFGLPVIAADVGSLREEIVEGETGFVCRAEDSSDLAAKLAQYFESQLFRDLSTRRQRIREYARERYSWKTVAETTASIYARLGVQ